MKPDTASRPRRREGAHGRGRVPPPGAVPPAAQDEVAAVERGPGRRLAVDGHELDPVAGRSATGGRTRHVARTHGRVEAVRLEAGAGDGDVEPELVEDSGRRARADVAAERPVDVEVDRLQRVAVRLAYTPSTKVNSALHPSRVA